MMLNRYSQMPGIGKGYAARVATILCLVLAPSASADTFRIEIDYMVDTDHTHEPGPAVISAVQQMFTCQGHNLVIEVDDALPHYDVLRRDPNDCSKSLFDYAGSADSFGALYWEYCDHKFDLEEAWHYCIFAHQYEDDTCNTTSSSGLGQIAGEVFIVTLGGFTGQTGTPFDQASTLAHEFGHNLGLTHCGSMECADSGDPEFVDDYAPNLPSTMSYRYQLAGVYNQMICLGLTVPEAPFKNLDYSHGRMCGLDENSLSESFGSGMSSTDWNCDGSLGGVMAQDISSRGSGDSWCGASGNRTLLWDYDEWSNIVDYATVQAKEMRPVPREVSCITAEEWERVKVELRAQGGCPEPVLVTEPCLTGLNVYIGPTAVPVGTCTFPIPSVLQAQSISPSGSVYYITPGTYDERGTVLLTKPGVYYCHNGTAIIK